MSGHVANAAVRSERAEPVAPLPQDDAQTDYDDLGNVARIRQLIADLLTSPQLTEADRRRDAFQRAFYGMSLRG